MQMSYTDFHQNRKFNVEIWLNIILGFHWGDLHKNLIIFMDNIHSEFYPNGMENVENQGKFTLTPVWTSYDFHLTDFHETQYYSTTLRAHTLHGISRI
jgi:hypothetical protein